MSFVFLLPLPSGSCDEVTVKYWTSCHRCELDKRLFFFIQQRISDIHSGVFHGNFASM